MAHYIVKRKGHPQAYDEKKVYGSVYSAILNCDYSEVVAEKGAEKIMKIVNSWIKKNPITNSVEIADKIEDELNKIDPDFAVVYKYHLDLC